MRRLNRGRTHLLEPDLALTATVGDVGNELAMR